MAAKSPGKGRALLMEGGGEHRAEPRARPLEKEKYGCSPGRKGRGSWADGVRGEGCEPGALRLERGPVPGRAGRPVTRGPWGAGKGFGAGVGHGRGLAGGSGAMGRRPGGREAGRLSGRSGERR